MTLSNTQAFTQKYVCIVPYDREENKVFLLKRCGKHSIGKWEFPAGKVESNEPFEYAAMREFREEVGVDMFSIQFITEAHVRDAIDATKTFHSVYFSAERLIFDRDPINNEPDIHSEFGWFTFEELAEKDLTFAAQWMVDAISAGTVKL